MDIVIAILAKDKDKYLPLYLQCIENQTINPSKIHIYIRTNNNTDNTLNILKEWIEKVKDKYASIYINAEDVSEKVERFGEHEWNEERFKVLATIRQESINYAISKNCDYFVVDCDNFIIPSTLEDLINTKYDVIAPLLLCNSSNYSNYHHCADDNGYFKSCDHYLPILKREKKDIHLCDVVHCTYFIRNEVLDKISYFDGSKDYEYVIFSRNCRKSDISQFLDTRKIYGYLILEDKKTADIFLIEKLMNNLSGKYIELSFIDNSVNIYYGIENNYVDVTKTCYDKLLFNDKLYIISNDYERSLIFGDHLPNISKHIKIENNIYNEDQEIIINI